MTFGIRAADIVGEIRVVEGYPKIGHWLKYYDPDAAEGAGEAEFTYDASEALRFETYEDAWMAWAQRSTVRPDRIDGKPNRPLTAVTIVVEELDSAPEE